MIKKIKTFAEKFPYSVGRTFSVLPFSLRLGSQYKMFHSLARASLEWNDRQREDYSIKALHDIVEYAKDKYPCYRDYYQKHGVLELEIHSLNDFRRLPPTDKSFFRKHAGDFSGVYRLNTGGTTGTPFSFYVDKHAWAREWAHMHLIWEMRDYHYMNLNLALRGKNLGNTNIRYNPVHNEFLINTYHPVSDYLPELRYLFRKRRIQYIHGYPSAVYNFIIELEKNCTREEIFCFLAPIKGVLPHSEFPFPYMKEKFMEWNLPCISWYGHSEMCILAYDKDFNNSYRPFSTYGYAEVSDSHLLGTSFHNNDMPLIRYDTGDLVTQLECTENGLCKAFGIAEGRNGDFIEDRNGKQIPLTSLIFGRHHKAFDMAEHIQIHQESPGNATIYLIKPGAIVENPEKLFDLGALDISFHVEQRNTPILSSSGKLKLKV